MQEVASAKVARGVKASIENLAEYEHKTISQLIKDALNMYAMRHCEILLWGLDNGVLRYVEESALGEMRYYRDLANSFKANYDSVQT